MKTAADPRHLNRIKAVKQLFAYTFLPQELDNELAAQTLSHLTTIDEIVVKCAPEWPLSQINRVDLSVLRVAINELLNKPEVPTKVVIDEAIEIAKTYGTAKTPKFINGVLGSIVKNEVKGYISKDSIGAIASLLESYKNHEKKPQDEDIELVYREGDQSKVLKRHVSDYYLTLKSDPSKKYLIELKIGGDLDNKKARSEKEALLEQYVILRNSEEIKPTDTVKIFFCTAYNKYGEDAKWTQERVRQFFCDNEIKVGRDFWNFFCNSPDGYEVVKSSYLKHAHFLKDALKEIVEHFASS